MNLRESYNYVTNDGASIYNWFNWFFHVKTKVFTFGGFKKGIP